VRNTCEAAGDGRLVAFGRGERLAPLRSPRGGVRAKPAHATPPNSSCDSPTVRAAPPRQGRPIRPQRLPRRSELCVL